VNAIQAQPGQRTIIAGDCIEGMRTLPAGVVHTCVTSPPYWGLRDYGVEGQIGLEETPDAYVGRMVDVFREIRRVLRDDGTAWLNLGDSYAGGGGYAPSAPSNIAGSKQTSQKGSKHGGLPCVDGLKPKDLVGIPWRVAFALQADGWYLRSDVIWHKPNPMPESVTDRPTKAHEYVFLLAKAERYFYDADAVSEPALYAGDQLGIVRGTKRLARAMGVNPSGNERPGADADIANMRNRRTVWTITPEPFSGAHFATMPPELARLCILAGSPYGGLVLDPFAGSGTTGVVAREHGRAFVGCELNPAYVEMAERRIGAAREQLRLFT
jgi:DNA modification methylase